MAIKKIMVVGAGLMGSGISQVAAQAGYNVIMNDVKSELVGKGLKVIAKNLDGQIKKEKITADDKNAILSRIVQSISLDDAKQADFVIEAAFENFEVKKSIFEKLDALCPPEVIFASNTSSIPITSLATTVKRSDKFIGMHFFSPVPVMKLVEVIPGLKTSPETIKVTEELAVSLKKDTVRVKDVPGFLVNRINAAFRAEVFNCLLEGVATLEDIDKAVKLGLNHPMGPFELNDAVGIDIGLNVFKTLYEGYKDPKFRPPLLMEKIVQAGDLGKKTGKGWYDYTSGEKKPRKDLNL
ncbi:MAG TPA: 3-hydroxyacyl-CoA dehydrogenase NAD-binding domain-containing protein [Smithellaceae bacterium]|nr:3-hydroxyacyl-CoA dehydrogenase NAD-binding domain-containing protein [Smithellaceae bacterium]HRS88316.1 3-hydroxyacyl-CoA dehydrogenase NAD-binding domain-containing protein [Smithellaceae bacterium]HRV24961.1 3-hydroxyacyl-CoA dehydrogenase NAD-binding domain-containing protein [Smithellaceae bacterium]